VECPQHWHEFPRLLLAAEPVLLCCHDVTRAFVVEQQIVLDMRKHLIWQVRDALCHLLRNVAGVGENKAA
jgi:hypothetical protein